MFHYYQSTVTTTTKIIIIIKTTTRRPVVIKHGNEFGNQILGELNNSMELSPP
jgi:hypothetical protein